MIALADGMPVWYMKQATLFFLHPHSYGVIMKTCIDVDALGKGGPYSHSVKANGFVFVSGNVAIDPESGEQVRGDIPKATRIILKNIETILKAAGADLSKAVKTTVFLTDMGNFPVMNEAYKEFFPKDPPARSCVAVKQLPMDFDIEIELIALAE
jgi:2-iminobutanoate/2-iminopropanoate deaminase